jgi:hypothetical protein
MEPRRVDLFVDPFADRDDGPFATYILAQTSRKRYSGIEPVLCEVVFYDLQIGVVAPAEARTAQTYFYVSFRHFLHWFRNDKNTNFILEPVLNDKNCGIK